MTMRALPWLLALMMMATPLAFAEGDEDDPHEAEETEERDGGGHEGDEGEEEAGHDDERDDDDERKVDVEVDGLKAKIKLERETNATEDKIEMAYDASEAKLEVKYEAEANDTESEQKLRARFHEILEYVDADGDGAYDAGETIASAYSLGGGHELSDDVNGSATWAPIQMGDVVKENVTGKTLESRATFGDGGVFGLVFYVYGDFTMVEGSTLQPTEAKIDIIIQDYPYVRNDTRLGVVVSLKAEESFESEHEFVDDDEEGVAASGNTTDVEFSLVFTWKDTARVDGADTPVGTTVLKDRTSTESEDGESSSEQKVVVVLSYARGADILHDPTAGVSYRAMGADASTSAVPLAPALALVAIAGAAIVLRRRTK